MKALVGFVLTMLIVVLAGCVQRYPLGMTETEWTSLPPQKQAEYRAQQHAADVQQRQQKEAQRIEQQRLAAEAAATERNRVIAAYDRARYGDIVTVNITGARMYYGKTIWPCEPVSFDLVKSERKEVRFTGFDPAAPSRRLVQNYWVSLSDDGHTFTFNHSNFGGKLVLINDGWRNGRQYQNLSTPQGKRIDDLDIMNMAINIRFRDVNDGQRVIIEHR